MPAAAPKPASAAPKPVKKAAAKPAWANTEKQAEENKEAEIDELLEFAYELDYEQYMEDFEVRQALAVIKDRVQEIKQEPDWKQKMADEWNAEATQGKTDDVKSHASYQSNMTGATGVSKQSYSKRMAEAKEKADSKAEWDNGSMTSEVRQKRAEDRMASKIAAEVLKDNQKLRGVHSKESIKKILEKEALRQMQAQGEYPHPVISKIVEKK